MIQCSCFREEGGVIQLLVPGKRGGVIQLLVPGKRGGVIQRTCSGVSDR